MAFVTLTCEIFNAHRKAHPMAICISPGFNKCLHFAMFASFLLFFLRNKSSPKCCWPPLAPRPLQGSPPRAPSSVSLHGDTGWRLGGGFGQRRTSLQLALLPSCGWEGRFAAAPRIVGLFLNPEHFSPVCSPHRGALGCFGLVTVTTRAAVNTLRTLPRMHTRGCVGHGPGSGAAGCGGCTLHAPGCRRLVSGAVGQWRSPSPGPGPTASPVGPTKFRHHFQPPVQGE